MKAITYWCPTCKKELVYKTDEVVIPSQMICAKCEGQVWKREIKEEE